MSGCVARLNRASEMKERSVPVRLVCFDVDGTLIDHPEGKTVWQLLNDAILGDSSVSARRFDAFKAGRITYSDWVALDLLDWKSLGVARSDLVEIIESQLYLNEGVKETFDELDRRSVPVAIVSGTIDLTLRIHCGDLTYDREFSNRIHFDDAGRITGWEATPYDVGGKAAAIDLLAGEYGLSRASCAFVGDGWNDIPAMAAAGRSVAFRPKLNEVREAADAVIEDGPLTELFELFDIEGGLANG